MFILLIIRAPFFIIVVAQSEHPVSCSATAVFCFYKLVCGIGGAGIAQSV